MMKKGDISLTVIITAAIALVVMVVLIAVFTGKIGEWRQDVTDVQEGGTCADITAEQGGPGNCRNLCLPEEAEVFGKFSDCTGATIHCCISK